MFPRETASAVCFQLSFGYGYSTLTSTKPLYFWEHPISKTRLPLIWLDQAHLSAFPDRKLEVELAGLHDSRVRKAPWGRALTPEARCNGTQTLSIHCVPLLRCWACKSSDHNDCLKPENLYSKTVSTAPKES